MPQLRVAADSNAAVYVDGQLLTRKVTRYREQNITADVIPLPQGLVRRLGTSTVDTPRVSPPTNVHSHLLPRLAE